MADPDANDVEPILLAVDVRHVAFLRSHLRGVRAGLVDDLTHHESQLSDPGRDRAVAARLDHLLSDLEHGRLTGTRGELEHVLTEHLRVIDQYNEFERVVAEHDAFTHLLAQLPGRS